MIYENAERVIEGCICWLLLVLVLFPEGVLWAHTFLSRI